MSGVIGGSSGVALTSGGDCDKPRRLTRLGHRVPQQGDQFDPLARGCVVEAEDCGADCAPLRVLMIAWDVRGAVIIAAGIGVLVGGTVGPVVIAGVVGGERRVVGGISMVVPTGRGECHQLQRNTKPAGEGMELRARMAEAREHRVQARIPR